MTTYSFFIHIKIGAELTSTGQDDHPIKKYEEKEN